MKTFFRYLMGVLCALAGINHFVHPEFYLRIMPPWLPAHEALVFISGVAELVLGIGILFNPTRRIAAIGIILLLLAVLPANIQMLLNWQREGHPHLWLAWMRLPMQAVLIWWAWLYARRKDD